MNQNRQADEPLERLLSKALRAGHPADVCPDAEQLASFVERSLDTDAARQMERHVADCARCAAVVSTLLDVEPAVAARSSAAWWSVWGVRLAVPLATAVVVVGVWLASSRPGNEPGAEKPLVVVSNDVPGSQVAAPALIPPSPTQDRQTQVPPSRQRSEPKKSASVEVAPSSLEKVAPPDATPDLSTPVFRAGTSQNLTGGVGFGTGAGVAGAAPSQPPLNGLAFPTAPAETTATARAQSAAPVATPPPPSPSSTVPAPPPPGSLDDVTAQRRDARSTAAEGQLAATRRDEPAAAAVATAPAPAPPDVQAKAEAPVVPPAPLPGAGGRGGRGGGGGGRAGGAGGGRGGAAAPGGPSGGRAVAGATADGLNQGGVRVDGMAVQAFAPIVLQSTSGSATRWRVQGVLVERSADSGATWAAVYTAPRPLSAGAVANDDTVWLAGQQGLVVRGTVTGWATVTAPAAIDVTSVSQVTTRGATVRTSDGRDFRTDDGGVTWVQR